MTYYFKNTAGKKVEAAAQLTQQQRKQKRKHVSRLARTLMWSLRIFLACVMLITSYNVALNICDVFLSNYTLWLSSTIASCAFCGVSILIITAIYFYLKNLTKSLSQTSITRI